MPLSVTALNVPLPVPVPRPKRTVKPPLVRLAPPESLACRVTVAELPEAMLAGDTDTIDCDRLGAAVTVTVGAVDVTAEPLIVEVMSIVPTVVPVNVAM